MKLIQYKIVYLKLKFKNYVKNFLTKIRKK